MRSRNNYSMHTFVVLEKNGRTIDSDVRIGKIKRSLEIALQGERKKRFAPQRLSRKIKPFAVKPKVEFISSTHKNSTTVEITALDVPGLLLHIGHIFQQCQLFIHAARITTIGEKAEDMFVLSTTENKALDHEQRTQLADVISNNLTTINS
jgi:[protein-PII] uridylyltransferase